MRSLGRFELGVHPLLKVTGQIADDDVAPRVEIDRQIERLARLHITLLAHAGQLLLVDRAISSHGQLVEGEVRLHDDEFVSDSAVVGDPEGDLPSRRACAAQVE